MADIFSLLFGQICTFRIPFFRHSFNTKPHNPVLQGCGALANGIFGFHLRDFGPVFPVILGGRRNIHLANFNHVRQAGAAGQTPQEGRELHPVHMQTTPCTMYAVRFSDKYMVAFCHYFNPFLKSEHRKTTLSGWPIYLLLCPMFLAHHLL